MEAASEEAAEPKAQLSAAELDTQRRRANLLLGRAQVLQQLEASTNPRHRQMLLAALADLDARLDQLS